MTDANRASGGYQAKYQAGIRAGRGKPRNTRSTRKEEGTMSTQRCALNSHNVLIQFGCTSGRVETRDVYRPTPAEALGLKFVWPPMSFEGPQSFWDKCLSTAASRWATDESLGRMDKSLCKWNRAANQSRSISPSRASKSYQAASSSLDTLKSEGYLARSRIQIVRGAGSALGDAPCKD